MGTERAAWGPFLREVSALGLVGMLGLVATAYVAMRTSRGIRLDLAASDAVSSPARVLGHFYAGMAWVSVGSVGVSLLVCVAFALLQRRFDLAVGAVVVIVGGNVTTQVLKYDVFPHVDLSPEPSGLPSGHTTVALSVALAAVIVAPSAWRSIVAIVVSATSSFMGVGLVLGRFHAPADVLAATFVCVIWAAIGLSLAVLVRNRPPVPAPAQRVSLHAGALLGAALVGGLLVAGGVRPQPGLRDLGLGIVSLGSIGLACAVSVAAVAHVADRHLG